MYGSGVRSAEQLSLRVKDIDFSSNNVIVRSGKGDKDRSTMLPQRLVKALKRQIKVVELLHAQDQDDGFGEVYLPDALDRKYPTAARETAWQFLFPATRIGRDPRSGVLRRHHLHPTALTRQIRRAVREAGIHKPARSHSFVIASLHTFLKTAMICAPFRSYWVTPILRPPKSIPTLSIVGAKAC